MTVALILVLFAGLALVMFLFWNSTGSGLASETNLSHAMSPVDLEAFRNLIDEEEDRFLRANLPVAAFRSIQRRRMRAAVDYVAGASHNAAILLQLGQAARRSPDPQVAEAGRHLVDTASRLRVYSLIAIAKLYGRIFLPDVGIETTKLADQYERMKECASLVSRLRDPASAGSVSRAL